MLNYAQPVRSAAVFQLNAVTQPRGGHSAFWLTIPVGSAGSLAIVAIGASIGLSIWLSRIKADEKLLAVALPLIIGGALGNLYDRLVHGYVVDFLSFHAGGLVLPGI